jgi:hypothetical protein
MKTLQEMLDSVGQSKIAKFKTNEVHHYYGKLSEWRNSQENRLKNMGKIKQDQKLTPQIAVEIRRLNWEENISVFNLSKRFGVGHPSIRKILNNKRFWQENPKYIGINKTPHGNLKKVCVSS